MGLLMLPCLWSMFSNTPLPEGTVDALNVAKWPVVTLWLGAGCLTNTILQRVFIAGMKAAAQAAVSESSK